MKKNTYLRMAVALLVVITLSCSLLFGSSTYAKYVAAAEGAGAARVAKFSIKYAQGQSRALKTGPEACAHGTDPDDPAHVAGCFDYTNEIGEIATAAGQVNKLSFFEDYEQVTGVLPLFKTAYKTDLLPASPDYLKLLNKLANDYALDTIDDLLYPLPVCINDFAGACASTHDSLCDYNTEKVARDGEIASLEGVFKTAVSDGNVDINTVESAGAFKHSDDGSAAEPRMTARVVAPGAANDETEFVLWNESEVAVLVSIELDLNNSMIGSETWTTAAQLADVREVPIQFNVDNNGWVPLVISTGKASLGSFALPPNQSAGEATTISVEWRWIFEGNDLVHTDGRSATKTDADAKLHAIAGATDAVAIDTLTATDAYDTALGIWARILSDNVDTSDDPDPLGHFISANIKITAVQID
ncbi:MAG: hypothetical protein FWH26_11475 [Oscillospiraceae bacterium]|nr:hypothetical protein [Oscillospiraceae bacterium]